MDQTISNQQLLILMKGHPGCAKSTVSRALARALRCPVVDKDDIHDATLCLEASDRPAPPAPTALNTLSYDVMWRVVETQLQIGLSVVVDCPLARHSLFQISSRLAQLHGCTLLVVECVAGDLAEWKRRLEARARTALCPVPRDKTTDSPMIQSSKRVEKSDSPSRDEVPDFCGESSETQNQKGKHFETILGINRSICEGADDSGDMACFTVEKASRHWHKPSLWEKT